MIQLAGLPRMTGITIEQEEDGIILCRTTKGLLQFLTNGIGEIAHFNQGFFEAQKIPYGMCAEEPYPLTEEEQRYISEYDNAPWEYPARLLTGYSILWQEQKWFCPTLEYCYQPDDPDKERLRAFVEQEAVRLHSLLIPLGGTMLLDLEEVGIVGLSDRYILYLPIPCTSVLEHFASGEHWMDFLFALFPTS